MPMMIIIILYLCTTICYKNNIITLSGQFYMDMRDGQTDIHFVHNLIRVHEYFKVIYFYTKHSPVVVVFVIYYWCYNHHLLLIFSSASCSACSSVCRLVYGRGVVVIVIISTTTPPVLSFNTFVRIKFSQSLGFRCTPDEQLLFSLTLGEYKSPTHHMIIVSASVSSVGWGWRRWTLNIVGKTFKRMSFLFRLCGSSYPCRRPR